MKGNSGFSLRDLVKPGLGALTAMQRDVEERWRREAPSKPPTWRYTGEAGILKAHGTFFAGHVLPDAYDDLVGPQTECHLNALAACEARPELRYFTGLYLVGQQVTQHSWCVGVDGKVVEVTFPTKGLEPNAIVAPSPGAYGVPWMPPDYWSYCGLEFDVRFVLAVIEHYGQWLPLLEPLNPYAGELYSTPYRPGGFPIP